MSELRECPFCGGVAQEGAAFSGGWIVECASSGYDCPVNPDVFGFERAEAVAAWNRRASDRYTVTDQGRAMLKEGEPDKSVRDEVRDSIANIKGGRW